MSMRYQRRSINQINFEDERKKKRFKIKADFKM